MSDIWLRERERRKALWQLAELVPGDQSARAILERLEELERLNHEVPLSACHLDHAELVRLPREAHPVGVLDNSERRYPRTLEIPLRGGSGASRSRGGRILLA